MPLSSRFTLLLIQLRRHPACTSSQVPLQLQGLINGSSPVDSSQRQILQEPASDYKPTLWTSLLSSRWEVYLRVEVPLLLRISITRYYILPSLT